MTIMINYAMTVTIHYFAMTITIHYFAMTIMINYARTITLNYFDLWTCKGSSASSEATQ